MASGQYISSSPLYFRFGFNNRYRQVDGRFYNKSTKFLSRIEEYDVDNFTRSVIKLINSYLSNPDLRLIDFNSMARDFVKLEFNPNNYVYDKKLNIILTNDKHLHSVNSIDLSKSTMLSRNKDKVIIDYHSREEPIIGFKPKGQLFDCNFIAYNGHKYCYVKDGLYDWRHKHNNPMLTDIDKYILDLALGSLL